jgi:hypothetical protein
VLVLCSSSAARYGASQEDSSLTLLCLLAALDALWRLSDLQQ